MKWTSGLSGYVEISLWGTNPEKVINMALSRGITIWDIRPKEKNHYQLKVSLGGYKALRILIRRSSCKAKIIKKKGIPFFLMRAKRRKILVCGTLFFCLTLYILGSFVWFVEVIGNEKVLTETIIAKAQEFGLKRGASKAGFNKNEIEDRLLVEIPELSWVGIHIQGTKIIIEVAEKTLLSAEHENNPADLIAGIDGTVEELLIFTGTPQVKEGDIVKKGQVLISSLVYPRLLIAENGDLLPDGDPEQVKARGVIRARVTRSQMGQCALREKISRDTGKEKNAVILKLKAREVYLRGTAANPFANYRIIRQVKPLFAFKGRNTLGTVELITITYVEQIDEIRSWGIEGAYQEAARRVKEELRSVLPADCRIISEKFEPVLVKDEKLVTVKYELETIENIGIYPNRQRR
jgi:similar to stage IV sporulation protein